MKLNSRRITDIVVSGTALTVLSIPLAFALTATAITMHQNPVLRQKRVGLHNTPFTIYKIRTMHEIYDQRGRLLPDAERVTRFGSLLRRCGGDEMLQLWNILKGDMSIVGPRPMPLCDQPLTLNGWAARHQIRPGLMSYAGAIEKMGKGATSYEARLQNDLYYIKQRNLSLDLKVAWMITKIALLGKNDDPRLTRPPDSSSEAISTNLNLS